MGTGSPKLNPLPRNLRKKKMKRLKSKTWSILALALMLSILGSSNAVTVNALADAQSEPLNLTFHVTIHFAVRNNGNNSALAPQNFTAPLGSVIELVVSNRDHRNSNATLVNHPIRLRYPNGTTITLIASLLPGETKSGVFVASQVGTYRFGCGNIPCTLHSLMSTMRSSSGFITVP